jgi:hypothetical protein
MRGVEGFALAARAARDPQAVLGFGFAVFGFLGVLAFLST